MGTSQNLPILVDLEVGWVGRKLYWDITNMELLIIDDDDQPEWVELQSDEQNHGHHFDLSAFGEPDPDESAS